MNSGEPHNAELVYNTCITLEPDQPEGYLERARAIMEQTVKYPLAAQTDLPRRALEDLDRALELRPLLPAVRRTRADLFARFRQLGRRGEAIAEYTRWLELIRPIYMYRGRTSQRGLIRGCQQIKEFCQTLVIDGEEVVAARELLALAQLAQRDFRGARKTISRMNEADTQRATVLRIRGSLKLKQATRGKVSDRGLLQQSLQDFDAALRLTPDRYWVEIGRVRVLLRLEKNNESLQALDEMLERNIAQTDWQEYDINAHR
ncbi:MAG: hypothetical protein IH991_16455, partial [Planctomycetes bacterium]|nr:hypothetical protein [Planctomycetota bacterium]